MTAPASPTPRSTTTNKPSPPPGSGDGPTPGSPPTASPSNGSSPTTAPATAPGSGTPRCAETGITLKRTRPYRPQTNGKVERFHRILLEEWAYIRPWRTDRQRALAYDRLHPLLQSPPIPRRTRLVNTHRHPPPPHRGQPPRGAQLAGPPARPPGERTNDPSSSSGRRQTSNRTPPAHQHTLMPCWGGHEELPVGIRCTRSGAPFCSAMQRSSPSADAVMRRGVELDARVRNAESGRDQPKVGQAARERRADLTRWTQIRRVMGRPCTDAVGSIGAGRESKRLAGMVGPRHRERAEAVPAFLCVWRALGSDTDSARLSLDGLERSGYAAEDPIRRPREECRYPIIWGPNQLLLWALEPSGAPHRGGTNASAIGHRLARLIGPSPVRRPASLARCRSLRRRLPSGGAWPGVSVLRALDITQSESDHFLGRCAGGATACGSSRSAHSLKRRER